MVWRESRTQPLKCLELDTVTYGTKSAPYLACRTMLDLADRHTHTHKLAADCIKSSGYIDDYLHGAQTLDECKQLCSELIDLLGKAGFHLHKWSANHSDVYFHVAQSDLSAKIKADDNCTPYEFTLPDSVKTLGLK